MRGPYCEILNPKFRSTDRACVKTEGLVFQGTVRVIRPINSLLHEKKTRKYSERLSRIHGQFSNKPFYEICTKSFPQDFLLIF